MNIFERTIPLSETTKFIVDNRGKTAPTADTGIALIATNCVSNEHLFPQYINLRRVSQETYDTWFRAHPEPGDIILTNKGSKNGAICLVPEPVDFVIAQDMVALRANEDVIDPLFLFAALRSPDVQRQIKNLDVSGVIPHFKKTDFDKLHLPYPDTNSQKVIGSVYFNFCAKIESNHRMNDLLDGMARAIFKAWFIDCEPVKAKAAGAVTFPGMPQHVFDQLPNTFVNSELGEIPEGWAVAAVADLGSFVNGRAFTKHANRSGRMIIRIAELNSGPSGSTKYSDIESDPENTSFPGDILFAWSGSLDAYRWHRDEAIINQHIFKVIPDGFPSWFVFYQLVQAMPFFKTIASTKATTMGHIKRGHLSQAMFAVPPAGLIEAAGTQIRPSYDLIHVNERESIRLAETRDTLLPKLISGELQVKGA